MKVSLVTVNNFGFFGGGENFLLQLASVLTKKGHNVNLISFNLNSQIRRMPYTDIFKFLIKTGVKIDRLYFYDIQSKKLLDRVVCNSAIDKLLKSSDVIYFNNFADLFKSIRLLKIIKKLQKRIIIGLHGAVVGHIYDKYRRRYVNLADHLGKRKYLIYKLFKKDLYCLKIHAINHEQYINFKREHFYVRLLPNGVYFDQNMSNKELLFSNDTFNVIWIGRLTFNKGIDVLLNIIKYICQRYPEINMNFYIFGTSRNFKARRKIRINKCNIMFMGFVKPEFLHKCMLNSHLYISTSRMECLPLSAIEALVAGLPSVLSDISGHVFLKKIINDISLSNLNYKKYSDLIIHYYNMFNKSYEDYARLRKRISHIARQVFLWDKIGKYYLNFFEKVAGEIND